MVLVFIVIKFYLRTINFDGRIVSIDLKILPGVGLLSLNRKKNWIANNLQIVFYLYM